MTSNISSEASEYLDEALSIMQENSINRDRINWSALRAEVYAYAQGADSPSDTYDAIRFALGKLGDNHSFLITPSMDDPINQWC